MRRATGLMVARVAENVVIVSNRGPLSFSRDSDGDLVAHRGYQEAAEWMQRKIKEGGFPDYDCDAAVAVLLGAVVHYRVEEATFGAPPGDVDEERFVETWVDICMRLAESA